MNFFLCFPLPLSLSFCDPVGFAWQRCAGERWCPAVVTMTNFWRSSWPVVSQISAVLLSGRGSRSCRLLLLLLLLRWSSNGVRSVWSVSCLLMVQFWWGSGSVGDATGGGGLVLTDRARRQQRLLTVVRFLVVRLGSDFFGGSRFKLGWLLSVVEMVQGGSGCGSPVSMIQFSNSR